MKLSYSPLSICSAGVWGCSIGLNFGSASIMRYYFNWIQFIFGRLCGSSPACFAWLPNKRPACADGCAAKWSIYSVHAGVQVGLIGLNHSELMWNYPIVLCPSGAQRFDRFEPPWTDVKLSYIPLSHCSACVWGGLNHPKLMQWNYPIIEYGSTLYVGMTQEKNGGPIKRVQNLMFRTLPWM